MKALIITVIVFGLISPVLCDEGDNDDYYAHVRKCYKHLGIKSDLYTIYQDENGRWHRRGEEQFETPVYVAPVRCNQNHYDTPDSSNTGGSSRWSTKQWWDGHENRTGHLPWTTKQKGDGE